MLGTSLLLDRFQLSWVIYLEPSGLRCIKAYHNNPLTLINQPVFQFYSCVIIPLKPIQLTALGLLRQSNKGGTWLPLDFGHLGFNVFNQLLSSPLMGLLEPIYI